MLVTLAPVGARAAAIEDELVIQTPMSPFVVDSMLKEFVQFAREKWGVTLKTRVFRAGTPVSYEAVRKWAGQPEADVLCGGEPALFSAEEHTSVLQSHLNLVCRLLL